MSLFPRQVRHFCRLDDPPEPTPLVTPPQSSDDEEEWVCPSPAASPPRTLGAVGAGSREIPPSFSAPEGNGVLACHLPSYLSVDHAQSWPSINVSGYAALSCHPFRFEFSKIYFTEIDRS